MFPQRYDPGHLTQPFWGSFAPWTEHAVTVPGQECGSIIQPQHCCCNPCGVFSPGDAALLYLRRRNIRTLLIAASTLLTRQCQSETNASLRERNRENVVKYLNKAEDTDPVDLGFSVTSAKNSPCSTLSIAQLVGRRFKQCPCYFPFGKRSSPEPCPTLIIASWAGNLLLPQHIMIPGSRKGYCAHLPSQAKGSPVQLALLESVWWFISHPCHRIPSLLCLLYLCLFSWSRCLHCQFLLATQICSVGCQILFWSPHKC